MPCGDQADAPGRDDGVEGTAVEPPHHESLDGNPDEARRRGAAQDGKRQREAGSCGRDGDVGPAHDQLAMGEVDDPHHAENHREARSAQHEEGECVADLVQSTKDGFEHHRISLKT